MYIPEDPSLIPEDFIRGKYFMQIKKQMPWLKCLYFSSNLDTGDDILSIFQKSNLRHLELRTVDTNAHLLNTMDNLTSLRTLEYSPWLKANIIFHNITALNIDMDVGWEVAKHLFDNTSRNLTITFPSLCDLAIDLDCFTEYPSIPSSVSQVRKMKLYIITFISGELMNYNTCECVGCTKMADQVYLN